MNYRPGETLNNGKYIIEKQLGSGAFGITYKAVQNTVIKLPVVIKTPNPTLQSDKAYSRYVKKFIQEAELLGKLCQEPHPNIVKLIDYFEESDSKTPCLVMEFIPGQNFFDLIEPHQNEPAQPLPEAEAVNYICQIGDALNFMHQNSIVHSDIHPGNIMLSRRRHPILIDFGLAGDIAPSTSSFGSKFGHENFIPYERRKCIRNERVDIYGLAAILYYIVTGKLPRSCWDRRYEKADLIEPQQHQVRISNQINQAILAGMALEAQDRPQSMQEWLKLLEITPPPAPPRKQGGVPHRSVSDVTLSSDVGVDYTNLRDLLKAGKWREADEETLAMMLKVADREEEGWLTIESINNFPCTDLRTIDQLWVKYSNGRFGFSVQKRIWESVGGNPDADYETWCKFGDRVGWRVKQEWISNEALTFSTQACGHLPRVHLPNGVELSWSWVVHLFGRT
jgi:serine/threonine-protein kinase